MTPATSDAVPDDVAADRPKLTLFEVVCWLWMPVILAVLTSSTALFKDPGNVVATVFALVATVCLPFAVVGSVILFWQQFLARKRTPSSRTVEQRP